MCLFFLPAELGKAERVPGGHVAALEHTGQRSMTCSACFLQLDLSALINHALICAIPACINRVSLFQASRWAACVHELQRESHPFPVKEEQVGPPSPRKRSSCWVGQLHICPGWVDMSPGPHCSKTIQENTYPV